jgi:hypothetical protein
MAHCFPQVRLDVVRKPGRSGVGSNNCASATFVHLHAMHTRVF